MNKKSNNRAVLKDLITSNLLIESLRNHNGYENATSKFELFRYFMIISLCLYYTIWAKCPITGLVRTDLK